MPGPAATQYIATHLARQINAPDLENLPTNYYVNVAELRSALGLPAFDLCPPYRSPISGPQPATNMDDVDHLDIQDEEEEEDRQSGLYHLL